MQYIYATGGQTVAKIHDALAACRKARRAIPHRRDWCLVFGWAGALTADAAAVAAEQGPTLQKFAALGVRAIPRIQFHRGDGGTCLDGSIDSGSQYARWFDPAVWANMAELIRALAKYPAWQNRIVIDLEPYWDTQPRYPGIGEVFRLHEAMKPALAAIRSCRRRLMVLPGHPANTPSFVMAQMSPRATVMDEVTYKLAGSESLWPHIEHSSSYWRAMGDGEGKKYLPGFYGARLTDENFQEELSAHGVKDCWFWMYGPDSYGAWEQKIEN